MTDPTGPFIWESRELPSLTVTEDTRSFREVPPPTGYMLHSWRISPIGELVICWVRMPRDLGSELAVKLLDMTSRKEASG